MRISPRASLTSVAGVLLCAGALLAVGCSPAGGPPAVHLDRSACARCGMLVSELRFAAAFRRGGETEALVFDDIGCMLDAYAEESGPPAATWVMDADAGEWVAADAATFVAALEIASPMGGGMLAFGDRSAASTYAAAIEEGRVLDLAAALRYRAEHATGGKR